MKIKIKKGKKLNNLFLVVIILTLFLLFSLLNNFFKYKIENFTSNIENNLNAKSKKEIPKIIIQTWKNKDTSRFKAFKIQ